MTATEDIDSGPSSPWRDETDTDDIREVWEVVPGVHVPLPIDQTMTERGLTWSMRVEMVNGRLACTRLNVERSADEAPAITLELLRSFAIQRHVHAIVRNSLHVAVDGVDPFGTTAPEGDSLAAGPTDENLRYVASVYRLAEITDGSPTQAVESLGLSRRTAQRWVSSAREKGML